ncbi:hypothetical protein [Colwellia sp. Bg11-12]|uniref:hypothetical protein n=1 Tax=Colwellia sp. Bg11-12 TaxID=2759817 RepID=UPI0015F4C405|nr:hypothetical protein [Colwellia sp. Bg11-12]MBA6265459.1 hypothetical protein [Colwellia sp. Bg11-12]|tara:strand:+ start:217 stop:522 length:306 start_codon:yes stop_codon:yes gene_type:complete
MKYAITLLIFFSSTLIAVEYPSQKEVDRMCSGKYLELFKNDIKWKYNSVKYREGSLMGTDGNRSGQVMCNYDLSNIDKNMKKRTGYSSIVIETDGTWFEWN